MLRVYSCKNCKDRYMGCHSKCEKYLDEVKKNEKIKRYERKENIYRKYE